ncbi:hypothetical protein BIZ83_gp016 [Erwinia phage vB_EamM_ChrisDB]|uniref:hypothetical protein n=1 Tax=Erwinia phage vB_EamM_ChrisDB TaxID=1883371 RepID=UPI00081D22FC|nr:hypothetical protein BIZ83_gp016 [Erwinia phage vB_EamM_ChrisDB]ANZ48837.1 hypothetical protein CHRISDB_275 [Erwinia phage vB_EamM_ChrisDB]
MMESMAVKEMLVWHIVGGLVRDNNNTVMNDEDFIPLDAEVHLMNEVNASVPETACAPCPDDKVVRVKQFLIPPHHAQECGYHAAYVIWHFDKK